nr:YdeI/OmpD-associated family protein [uncultured Dyadobacter sp.]
MKHTDPRIDDYIAQSADFAVPILEYLRSVVHEVCPDVKETMKWSFPHFEYKASILCSMASFKQHCSFGFWLESRLRDPDKLLAVNGERTGMGSLGKIGGMEDLPAKENLGGFIRQAMQLIDSGVKISKESKPPASRDLVVPEYFRKALEESPEALKTFTGFSYTQKKEYVEWVVEAKAETTRQKRIATALEWLAEGKIRNWKYIR